VNLLISLSASERIIDVLSSESANKRLRVSVQGGGCSGYRYGFDLEETVNEDDTVISLTPEGSPRQFEIVIDCMSITFLEGSTLDYSSDEWDSKFFISNPNAISTCGCGSSFSV
jgi:iron-sulfur cluster insertion protein